MQLALAGRQFGAPGPANAAVCSGLLATPHTQRRFNLNRVAIRIDRPVLDEGEFHRLGKHMVDGGEDAISEPLKARRH
jgi:hypothetical protein